MTCWPPATPAPLGQTGTLHCQCQQCLVARTLANRGDLAFFHDSWTHDSKLSHRAHGSAPLPTSALTSGGSVGTDKASPAHASVQIASSLRLQPPAAVASVSAAQTHILADVEQVAPSSSTTMQPQRPPHRVAPELLDIDSFDAMDDDPFSLISAPRDRAALPTGPSPARHSGTVVDANRAHAAIDTRADRSASPIAISTPHDKGGAENVQRGVAARTVDSATSRSSTTTSSFRQSPHRATLGVRAPTASHIKKDGGATMPARREQMQCPNCCHIFSATDSAADRSRHEDSCLASWK